MPREKDGHIKTLGSLNGYLWIVVAATLLSDPAANNATAMQTQLAILPLLKPNVAHAPSWERNLPQTIRLRYDYIYKPACL